VSEGTGVPDAMCVAIAQRIDALKKSSARSGLPPQSLQDAVQCMVHAALLGLGSEHTTRLLWCLRPRETMQQSTMAQLLAAMNTSAFPSALRTHGLRWLLLMIQDDGVVDQVNPGVTEGAQNTQDSAGRAAVSRDQGDAGASSLACMITKLLRPLYRVIFHMLIAAYSCAPDSLHGARGAVPEASSWPPSSADRAVLCEILLKITSRREARACWLQIALVLAWCLRKARVVLAWCLRGACVVLAQSALRAWLPRSCLVAPRVVASRDGFPFFCFGLAWLGLACLALAKNGMSATTLRTAG
jgi:hypothetical protein